MNEQQFFSKVWDHFIVKRSPFSAEEGSCMYRLNGEADCPTRCAVGLIIPDDQYEDMRAAIRDLNGIMLDLGLIHLLPLSKVLQSSHDDASEHSDYEQLEERLRKVALDYDLVTP